MIPINEKKSWLVNYALNFTLIPVIWVCGLVYKNEGSISRSLEAQINGWGALMLLSTVTSLMGKAGEEMAYFLSRQKNWP